MSGLDSKTPDGLDAWLAELLSADSTQDVHPDRPKCSLYGYLTTAREDLGPDPEVWAEKLFDEWYVLEYDPKWSRTAIKKWWGPWLSNYDLIYTREYLEWEFARERPCPDRFCVEYMRLDAQSSRFD